MSAIIGSMELEFAASVRSAIQSVVLSSLDSIPILVGRAHGRFILALVVDHFTVRLEDTIKNVTVAVLPMLDHS